MLCHITREKQAENRTTQAKGAVPTIRTGTWGRGRKIEDAWGREIGDA